MLDYPWTLRSKRSIYPVLRITNIKENDKAICKNSSLLTLTPTNVIVMKIGEVELFSKGKGINRVSLGTGKRGM